MNTPEGIRIQKFLSQAGVSSRRQAERLMRAGRVKVNGEPVTELGTRIVPGRDRVEVDGRLVKSAEKLFYAVVYKPKGMITSLSDPEGRPVVTELLPDKFPRMWPVGRLDWESEGLVLMTNDGKLTHLVTHPSYHVEKSYVIKVRGLVTSRDTGLEMMRAPMTLDDGFVTSGAEVMLQGNTGRHTWMQITIHEGHNRQIRRMAETAGYTVLRLKRTSIGPVDLGELQPGYWRSLYADEVAALYKLVESKPPVAERGHPAKVPKPSPGGAKKKPQSKGKTKRRDSSRKSK